VVLAGVDHRLDGEGQAGAQARAAFGLANVGDGQLFVQRTADAVAAPFVDDADPLRVGVVLNGPADVVEVVVVLRRLDAAPQRFAADRQQALRLDRDAADGVGHAGVTTKPLVAQADVDADHV